MKTSPSRQQKQKEQKKQREPFVPWSILALLVALAVCVLFLTIFAPGCVAPNRDAAGLKIDQMRSAVESMVAQVAAYHREVTTTAGRDVNQTSDSWTSVILSLGYIVALILPSPAQWAMRRLGNGRKQSEQPADSSRKKPRR